MVGFIAGSSLSDITWTSYCSTPQGFWNFWSLTRVYWQFPGGSTGPHATSTLGLPIALSLSTAHWRTARWLYSDLRLSHTLSRLLRNLMWSGHAETTWPFLISVIVQCSVPKCSPPCQCKAVHGPVKMHPSILTGSSCASAYSDLPAHYNKKGKQCIFKVVEEILHK